MVDAITLLLLAVTTVVYLVKGEFSVAALCAVTFFFLIRALIAEKEIRRLKKSLGFSFDIKISADKAKNKKTVVAELDKVEERFTTEFFDFVKKELNKELDRRGFEKVEN